VSIRVEAVPDHGMATIWDADILIWAASQIVEARDAGLRTSRLMAPPPMKSSVHRPRHVLARLSAPQGRARPAAIDDDLHLDPPARRGPAASLLLDQRMEGAHRPERPPDGIELIVPDWFYQAVLDDALVLTIDRAYFDLTGGLDRWLYRIVRKHGGRQRNGWRFDFRHLHQKSGSLSPFKRFAFELRDIIRRQPLPGYTLFLEIEAAAARCSPSSHAGLWKSCGWRRAIGNPRRVPSGTGPRAIGNPNRP
jgi:plasmid replication initiation protein